MRKRKRKKLVFNITLPTSNIEISKLLYFTYLQNSKRRITKDIYIFNYFYKRYSCALVIFFIFFFFSLKYFYTLMKCFLLSTLSIIQKRKIDVRVKSAKIFNF